MWSFNFISPLHFFSLNYKTTRFSFSILCGCERDNELSSLLSIWFKLTTLRVNSEFLSRIWSKECIEIRKTLQMIWKFETNTACFMKWWLNNNRIIDFRIKSFKDYIKFPSSTTALVNNKFDISLKWSKWFKS